MFAKKIVMREYCPVVLFTESKINSTTWHPIYSKKSKFNQLVDNDIKWNCIMKIDSNTNLHQLA